MEEGCIQKCASKFGGVPTMIFRNDEKSMYAMVCVWVDVDETVMGLLVL